MAAGSGAVVWVLGGSVSAVNALTPRARLDPPEVGLELVSEVFYWSHPAWAIAATVFAVAVYLGSGLRVRSGRPAVLLPTVIAVASYALAGGMAEALLVNGPDGQGRSWLEETGGAIGTSLGVAWNGAFAAGVALTAFWQLGQGGSRRSGRAGPGAADPTPQERPEAAGSVAGTAGEILSR